MADLSVYVLGSFQVLRDGEIVTKTFRTSKERALLAYLAIECDRRHSRETLAELLWPDRPEGVARTNLRQALAGVRQAIGDRDAAQPHLKVSDESVRINPQNRAWLDVHTFEAHIQATLTHSHKSIQVCPVCAQHLEEAISLYRGDLLAELHLAGCQRFQEWVLFQREQYARQMLTALANLSRYDEQRGYLDSALKYARQHVKLAPLEEAAHRQVMQLLAQSGLRSAALEQYLTCRRTLAQELGVEPAPETEALFESLKHGAKPEFKNSTSPTSQNDLPLPLTSFVNRQMEMSWIAKCLPLPGQRLLTITGMPGIGKTRLALQAASANRPYFPDGVYFADLAAAQNADQIVAGIAATLALPPCQQSDPKEALLGALRPLRALIVLDNYEHLTGHTHLLLELLQQAPGIKLLVTSRQRLNFQSEVVLGLQGLDYLQQGEARQALDYGAVQLFLERARHSQPGFEPTSENMPAILRICQLLDGHPLGIELAAAALRESTCEQLAAALPDNLDLLQTTLQDIPEKHRSMRTILEGSWSALSPEEKEATRILAIFEGDFSLEAAQQVTAVPLHLLTSLVDKSMLCGCVAERFCLHPLIRTHARAKLCADQVLFERLKNRHSRYYLQLAQQMQSSPSGNGDGHRQDKLPQIEAEIENFRSALTAAAERGDTDIDNLTLENLGFSAQAQADGAGCSNQQPDATSLYDPLTGLPNNALFFDRLRYSLSLATRESRHFALLLLDLDSFRVLNENFGQESGDALLQLVAARLRECLRESDTLSRLGGDQFGIILENLQNPECASIVAGKILKKLAAPYQLAGGGIQITSSIGISYYPDSGTEPDSLVQNATRALKIVKSDGRNGYQLFRQTQTADLNI